MVLNKIIKAMNIMFLLLHVCNARVFIGLAFIRILFLVVYMYIFFGIFDNNLIMKIMDRIIFELELEH